MGRIYKIIGYPESYRHLWENQEALNKYLERLKELMEEDDSQKDEKTHKSDINNQCSIDESCK